MKTIVKICLVIVILSALSAGLVISGVFQNPTDMRKEINQPENIQFTTTISGDRMNIYAGSFGTITVNVAIPESPAFIPVYKGVFLDGDLVNKRLQSTKARNSVTSEQDAPEVAKRILENYGGLPSDAILTGAVTNYRELLDRSTLQVVDRLPLDTAVSWWRLVDGRPVVGDRDTIQVILGENGELIRIYKRWRTYTPAGDVSVISFSKAITKLEEGEVLNPTLGTGEDVYVYSTILGYYAKGLENPEITLEPVWIFYGYTSSGSYLSFQIYARQFANFAATPTFGKAPLTVTFTDTSDPSPTKWNWDFGDGVTSTDQNPVHTFQTAGTYTVTLKAWNDLGSDMMVKTSYILTGKRAIVMHIDTKLDELRNTLNAMNIAKGTKNSLMQKLENAQKKNGDALKFIDQNKETQANNMFNAEDSLMNAFMNEVNAQTGKAISTGDAAKLNDGATEIRGFIQKAIETPI